MNLSELIAAYGDDKVMLQNLDQAATSLNMNKRGSTITFKTEQRIDLNGTVHLGLVVWLDRARAAEILDRARAAVEVADRQRALASVAPDPVPPAVSKE